MRKMIIKKDFVYSTQIKNKLDDKPTDQNKR